MSLRVGAIGSYEQLASIKPLNYAISNNSKVSDAYQKSVKSAGEIDLVQPVRYPNAQAVPVDAAEQVQKAQAADRSFREIASRYAGSSVGYGADSSAAAYSMTGSMFDAIA